METLLDLLSDIRRLDRREAIRFTDGYRTRKLSYREVYDRIGGVVRMLDERGFQKGDRLLLWGENRPEWVAVFWGCLARGVAVVPIDFHSSPRLVRRVQAEVEAKLLVHGQAVEAEAVKAERLSFDGVGELEGDGLFQVSGVSADDVVEIVYTSGTTGEPKGVVHRHRNICANLRAFQGRIQGYRNRLRIFQPIRVLDLLPLSHMFGQSLGLFIPVLLEGAAVFMLDLHPGEIVETLRRERASALVCVPRLLSSLQHEVERRFALLVDEEKQAGFLRRVWRHRHVHAALGWKFWFLVVGGARVDPEMETFWSRLGFAVVQGYGLTEASPVVALNHPFRTRVGSLGKALEGQEVKIAPDGEILVRGESIVSEYYGGGETEWVAEDGWLHTGDIGEMDAEGRLYYKGRKKEVIVTAEGLNVFPQDVEAALDRFPEVVECAVVGLHRNGDEQVHAVLVLSDPPGDPDTLVQKANRELEPHQRIRGWTVWPEGRLPRTASTFKVRRHEVAARLAGGERRAEPEATGVEGVLAGLTGREASELKAAHRLAEDLGLSSLDLVDLVSALEADYGVTLDEEALAQLSTVGELRAWVRQAGGVPGVAAGGTPVSEGGPGPAAHGASERVETAGPVRVPRWPRFWPVRWIRTAALEGMVLPFLRFYINLSVEGISHLSGVRAPVLFAANHASHLDAPAILAALPKSLRRRLAPAMRQNYFQAYFHPERFSFPERVGRAVQYWIVCGLLNAFPLPQEAGGVRRALKTMGGLTDQGFCPLVFPEGRRTTDGKLQPFRAGIGLMAVRLGIPVVPIHIRGLFEVLPVHRTWPLPCPVRVTIGRPLHLKGRDYAAAARQVEAAIQEMAES